MRLVILGSGTCVPSADRNAPGCFLEAGEGNYLVDCGSGITRQVARAGFDCRDIDAVFLTHLHPDHTSDLVPLLHALIASPGPKRENKLDIVGPRGTEKFWERCVLTAVRKPKTFSLDVVEIEDKYDTGSMWVTCRKTIHSDSSIAFRFQSGGVSVVITGDADYDGGLVDLAAGADILVADCSFPDELKVAGHMTPRDCGLLAGRAGVKKLVLTHLYPASVSDETRLGQCRAVFDGDVVIAEDFMSFELI